MRQRPRDGAPSGWSEDDFGPAEPEQAGNDATRSDPARTHAPGSRAARAGRDRPGSRARASRNRSVPADPVSVSSDPVVEATWELLPPAGESGSAWWRAEPDPAQSAAFDPGVAGSKAAGSKAARSETARSDPAPFDPFRSGPPEGGDLISDLMSQEPRSSARTNPAGWRIRPILAMAAVFAVLSAGGWWASQQISDSSTTSFKSTPSTSTSSGGGSAVSTAPSTAPGVSTPTTITVPTTATRLPTGPPAARR
jgi:hypothetical protein